MFQDFKDLLSAFHAHSAKKSPRSRAALVSDPTGLLAKSTSPGRNAIVNLPLFPLCCWRSHYSGTARVNITHMVKPLRGPYNSLHYGALVSMLQGEQLANTRAVRCKP